MQKLNKNLANKDPSIAPSVGKPGNSTDLNLATVKQVSGKTRHSAAPVKVVAPADKFTDGVSASSSELVEKKSVRKNRKAAKGVSVSLAEQ